MNTYYRPQSTASRFFSLESLMTILLLVSLVQIGLCFQACTELVPTISHSVIVNDLTQLKTNAPYVHDLRDNSRNKS